MVSLPWPDLRAVRLDNHCTEGINMNSRRRGFTLIELLIVVVIIGLLAAIAIPKFGDVKNKAHFAMMKTSLKNLGQAEEAYFADHSEYSLILDSLNFKPAAEMTLTIVEATKTGWSATITHPNTVPRICAFFLGTAAPVAPATNQGALGCQ
jgi:prepilin-type N-terminal cleavage/methylation domain-containing protein